MKNIKLAFAVMLIIIMAAFCITACSGGVEGTYKLVSIKMGDTTYKVGDTVEELDGQKLTDDFYTIELKEDGTATFASKLLGDEPLTGAYTLSEDEKTITFTMTGISSDITLTRDGNTLTMTQGSGDEQMVITFKK